LGHGGQITHRAESDPEIPKPTSPTSFGTSISLSSIQVPKHREIPKPTSPTSFGTSISLSSIQVPKHRENLQNVGGKAKPYQVSQFLKIVERHGLELED